MQRKDENEEEVQKGLTDRSQKAEGMKNKQLQRKHRKKVCNGKARGAKKKKKKEWIRGVNVDLGLCGYSSMRLLGNVI